MADGLSRSTLSRTTLVIVAVCAALAALLVVVLALKLLRASRRRPAAPLPPVQPLAHHRILKYDLLDSRPPSSVPDSPFPNPSFQSLDSTFPPPSPVSSISRAAPPRPLSTASLSSVGHMSRHTSRTNLRGVPHAPTSQVQIVLPAPLASTLPRPHSIRRDTEFDRMSFVDKWVHVGRDNSTPFSSMPSTPRSSRRASASATMTSPSSFTYFQHPSPPPPVPQIPKEMITAL